MLTTPRKVNAKRAFYKAKHLLFGLFDCLSETMKLKMKHDCTHFTF